MEEIFYFKDLDYVPAYDYIIDVEESNFDFTYTTPIIPEISIEEYSADPSIDYYILTYEKDGEIKHDYVESLWK